MKKSLFAIMIACAMVFTSCDTGSAQQNEEMEQISVQTEDVAQPTDSTPALTPLPEQVTMPISAEVTVPSSTSVRSDSGHFIPRNIETTDPVDNQNDTWGEDQDPAHTYTVSIYFIDTFGYEYAIDISEVAALKDTTADWTQEDEKFRKTSEEKITQAKKFFTIITDKTRKPKDFMVKYDGKKIYIYRNEKPIEKKIGNVKIRPTDPKPLWEAEYSVTPPKAT